MASLLYIAVNIIGPIFLVIGVAVFIGRRFNPEPRTLSTLLVYLFTPCLILDGISKSNLQANEIGGITAMVLLVTLAMVLAGWAVARMLHFDPALASAFILSVTLVNAANYGLPVNEFAFGPEGRQRAVVYYAVTVLIANNVGIFVVSRGKHSIRRALYDVIKTPLLYAGIIGVVLNFGKITLPLPVDRAISIAGQATVPCMLALLGLQLARVSIKGRIWPIMLATGIRLILGPIVALLFAALLGLTGVIQQVTVVQSSMPTAVLASAIATEFGGDNDFTSAAILVSTLSSIITLTVLLSILMR